MFLLIDLCTCHWLIPWLLPFLLGLLLGWLFWGRLRSRIEELEGSVRKLSSKNKALETEIESYQADAAQHKSQLSLLEGRIRERDTEVRELSDTITRQRAIISDFETSSASSETDDTMHVPDEALNIAGSTEELDDISDGDIEEVDYGVVTDRSEESSDDDVLEGTVSEEEVIEEVVVEEEVQEDTTTDDDSTRIQPLVSQDNSEGPNEALGISAKGSSKPDLYAVLRNDDLQIVEGIGPKMSEVLNNAGVNNWADLAGKSTEELRAILDDVNHKRYRIIDPSPWPKQAQLALDGNWDDLITLQKNLSSGRKAGATGETDSKVEKLLIKLGVLKKWKQNDLTAIEGIGPKISGLLIAAGITTWRELANTDVIRIQEILDAAGKRYKLADPSTWPKQAEMAADGRWDDLSEYQDFLQGGK